MCAPNVTGSKNVHSSIISNSLKVETIQCPLTEWINILGNTQTVKQFTHMNECVILHMSIWMSLTNLMVSRVSYRLIHTGSIYCSWFYLYKGKKIKVKIFSTDNVMVTSWRRWGEGFLECWYCSVSRSGWWYHGWIHFMKIHQTVWLKSSINNFSASILSSIKILH